MPPWLTMTMVSAATALVGMEFEREAVRSASREGQIDQQRLDFGAKYLHPLYSQRLIVDDQCAQSGLCFLAHAAARFAPSRGRRICVA